MSIVMVVLLGFAAWSSYNILTLKPGEQAVTTAGITVSKPTNAVIDARIDGSGYLRISYQDGSTREVGYIQGYDGSQGSQGFPGADGEDGKDGKTPIKGVDYSDGEDGYTPIKGIDYFDGTDGKTPIKGIDYFDGLNGAVGSQGISGANGDPTDISCVTRTTNSIDTEYTAWKYVKEPITAYRDIFKHPTWLKGSDCVDLRAT